MGLRLIRLIEKAQRDLRSATRGLIRDWRVTLIAVGSLGLGIGANATGLGVVQRLWHVAPPGIRDEVTLRRLYLETTEPNGRQGSSSVFDYPALRAFIARHGAVERLAGYTPSSGTLGRGEHAAHVNLEYVAGDLFGTLGAVPQLGRVEANIFTSDAGTPSAAISYGLWQSAFGGASGIIGREIVVDDRPYVVVAVMGRGFSGPELARTDVWLPAAAIGARLSPTWRNDWDAPWMFVVARVRSGASDQSLGAAMTSVFRAAYAGSDGGTRRARVWLGPLRMGLTGDRPVTAAVSMWVYTLAATLLLIAGLNAANLLVLRAANRSHELFVRRAVGATARDMLRFFLVEAELIAASSAVAALIFATLLDRVVVRVVLPNLDWTAPLLTGRAVASTLAVAAFIGFGIAIVPAATFGRGEIGSVSSWGGARLTARHGRFRSILVSVQAGLAVVLLVGAGVFLRSLAHANAIEYGVAADELTLVSVEWPRLSGGTNDSAHVEWHRRLALLQAVRERLQSNPGIAAVSVSMGAPFRSSEGVPVRLRNEQAALHLKPAPAFYAVDGRYFATVRTPIVQGRAISESDGAASPRVAVVSETMARQLWPSSGALNQCLELGAGATANDCVRVVGIAADIRNVRGTSRSQYYLPLSQTPVFGNVFMLVRQATSAGGFAPSVRQAFVALDPGIEYVDVRPMRAFIDPAFESLRLGTVMFGLLAALALAIATTGLLATIGYATRQRVRELGIRQALGATPSAIGALICTASVRATMPGVLLGAALAAMLTRFVQSVLYDTRALDPVVLAAVVALLFVVAVTAPIPIIVRVLRSPPAEALRAE